jgi:hypothetical protein
MLEKATNQEHRRDPSELLDRIRKHIASGRCGCGAAAASLQDGVLICRAHVPSRGASAAMAIARARLRLYELA